MKNNFQLVISYLSAEQQDASDAIREDHLDRAQPTALKESNSS